MTSFRGIGSFVFCGVGGLLLVGGGGSAVS